MKWKKYGQTIREFALALKITWMKIVKDHNENNKKTSNAILKSRLIQGILDAEPKFGEMLQFTTKNDIIFDNLAIEAEQKYDRFKITQERIGEHQWEGEPTMLNNSRLSESRRQNHDNREDEDDHFRSRTKDHGNQQIYRHSLVNDGRIQHNSKNWSQRESTRYNDMNYSYQRRNNIDQSGKRFSPKMNEQKWHEEDSECFKGTMFQRDAVNLGNEKPTTNSGFPGKNNRFDDNLDQNQQGVYFEEECFNRGEDESYDGIMQEGQYGSVNEDNEDDTGDYRGEYDINDEFDDDYGIEYGRYDEEYDNYLDDL